MGKQKDITWSIEKVNINDLIPADYNPRKITAKEREDLERSIKEFGQVIPVARNIGTRKNIIIGGHQRVTIYKDMGITEIDCLTPSRELTLEEEKRLNLRLNKNVASWDLDKLYQMDVEILLDVGFGDEELAALWDNADITDDSFNAEKNARELQKIRVKSGEVWQLGRHILMCGDGSDKKDVEKLMQGKKADMIYSDAPLKVKEAERKSGSGEITSINTQDPYIHLIDRALDAAKSVAEKNAHYFYWTDPLMIWALQMSYKDHAIQNKRVALWIQYTPQITQSVAFNRIYQPCIYGITGKPYINARIKNSTEVLNKEVGGGTQVQDDVLGMIDIWIESKKGPSDEYSTGSDFKPVTLHERPLKRCTAPGHIVLDQFGGGGSTLIACELLGRTCHIMEIDPVYATVILERFENQSGIKGKKLQ